MNTQFFDVDLIMALLGGKVSIAIAHKLNKNFRNHNIPITPDIWLVMLYLREKDGVTQNFLCTSTYKDKAWMNRTIGKMEAEELVLRRKGKEDLREKRVFLTIKGREVAEKAYQVANRTLMEQLRGLTTEQVIVCQETLRKVFENAAE
ncbi:MAG: MarR family transcriptional regulator [Bacteroidaceae bacterium]|nr:MarR family transcriptional regulator [Bacteroidaceae bacterium]